MQAHSSRALMDETRLLYARIVDLYASAGLLPESELNVFWGSQNVADMRAILAESADAREALERVQSTHLFQVNSSDPSKEYAVDWQLRELARAGFDLDAMPPALQESEFSPLPMRVTRGGRLLTPDFFRILNHALLVSKFCTVPGTRPQFMELGAGCGHLARLLTMLYPGSAYTIIDIPETLCFSYMFLRMTFPDRQAVLLTAPLDPTGAPPPADFLFVPTLLADSVGDAPIDVFLNTASMGEMKNEVIRHWMAFVQQQVQPAQIVTVNRYLNTIEPGVHDWRVNENECSVLYDDRWDLLHWELEPRYFRCPYILPLAARHLEIVGRRRSEPSTAARDTSRRRLEALRHQDWIKFAAATPAMTLRDHNLCADLTMDGALFALWDAIRLDRSPQTVELMLQYLATLLRRDDREFEEVFYYEALLERLIADDPAAVNAPAMRAWLEARRKRRATAAGTIRLIKAVGRYNIIAVGDRLIALAQALGPVDLSTERLGTRDLPPHILLGTDLTSLERRLATEYSEYAESVPGPSTSGA
jgi:hypothetical protein